MGCRPIQRSPRRGQQPDRHGEKHAGVGPPAAPRGAGGQPRRERRTTHSRTREGQHEQHRQWSRPEPASAVTTASIDQASTSPIAELASAKPPMGVRIMPRSVRIRASTGRRSRTSPSRGTARIRAVPGRVVADEVQPSSVPSANGSPIELSATVTAMRVWRAAGRG